MVNREDIDAKIEQCWRDGLSIGGTILAIYRMLGVRVTFDDVHPRFVTLSWERAA